MDDFIVSARKYRPSTFKSVVGQDSIVSTLKNAIASRHLAHSFLFCGQRGVGKTSCARILAKTINCEHLTADNEACNNCESCKSFNDGRSLNIHELDAASNNSVDDIRGLIEQVRSAPQAGKYKVYIIDEVHMLSAAAFNAFLKTLEEPPSYAIFILATTERHKIIPTILSRCQIFDFKRIHIKDVAKHLAYISSKEGIDADMEALHIIAEKADGSMRDALSIYDQMVTFAGKQLTYKKVIDNLNILDYDYYFKVTEHISNSDIPSALLVFDEILANGFDGHLFITGLSEHFRNLIVAKSPATAQLIEKGEQLKEKYIQQAAKYSESFLFNGLNLLNQCGFNYKMAVNQRLLVEITLIKLCNPSSAHTNTPPPPLPKPQVQVQTQPLQSQSQSQPKPQPQGQGQAQPLQPKPKPNIPSLTKILGDSSKQQLSKTANSAGNEPSNTLLSAEAINDAWKEYINANKEKKRSLCSILSIFSPVISTSEGSQLEITVGNSVQQQSIEEDKTNLLEYLRSRLNLQHLKMVINVSKTETKNKPYTAQEKYEYMKNKNSDVEKLFNQLGLGLA